MSHVDLFEFILFKRYKTFWICRLTSYISIRKFLLYFFKYYFSFFISFQVFLGLFNGATWSIQFCYLFLIIHLYASQSNQYQLSLVQVHCFFSFCSFNSTADLSNKFFTYFCLFDSKISIKWAFFISIASLIFSFHYNLIFQISFVSLYIVFFSSLNIINTVILKFYLVSSMSELL